MATPIMMPQLGESIVEGIIGKWLKREGEKVARFEPLVEITTDKVVVEMPSPVAGTLVKITAPEDATVSVGAEIAVIEEAVEAESMPQGSPAAGEAATDGDAVGQRASPAVRRLAQEHDIELARVKGTGLGGRVTKDDVLRFVSEREGERGGVGPETRNLRPETREEESLPLTAMRRQIAEHMVRSVQAAPHAWAMFEVDVTDLVRRRDALKDEFQRRERVHLTYLPFVIQAVAAALQEFRGLNASWGGDRIIVKQRINIGVAVGLDDGLIVPVIHDADGKSIAGLARALDDLVSRARAGRLTLEDVQGGTFTINNTGAFGSLVSMPIIHQPQAAILTTEAIVKRPVVVADAIAIRSVMNMCISFDHRMLDGGLVGQFMQRVKASLEATGPDTPVY